MLFKMSKLLPAALLSSSIVFAMHHAPTITNDNNEIESVDIAELSPLFSDVKPNMPSNILFSNVVGEDPQLVSTKNIGELLGFTWIDMGMAFKNELEKDTSRNVLRCAQDETPITKTKLRGLFAEAAKNRRNIEIRRLPNELGLAVFAARDIRAKEVIAFYFGHYYQLSDHKNLDHNLYSINATTKEHEDNIIINATKFGNEARFFAHAPDNLDNYEFDPSIDKANVLTANCDATTKSNYRGFSLVTITTTKFVAKGTMLAWDYRLNHFKASMQFPLLTSPQGELIDRKLYSVSNIELEIKPNETLKRHLGLADNEAIFTTYSTKEMIQKINADNYRGEVLVKDKNGLDVGVMLSLVEIYRQHWLNPQCPYLAATGTYQTDAWDEKYVELIGLMLKTLPKFMEQGKQDAELWFATHCKFCSSSPTDLLICGRCKKVKYCSAECQKKDWPDHKIRCGKR